MTPRHSPIAIQTRRPPTTLADIGGSLVGGLSSFTTDWVSRCHKVRRERVVRELEPREAQSAQLLERATGLFRVPYRTSPEPRVERDPLLRSL